MTPYDPKEILNEFLEYLDHRKNVEDPENFQRLMDWLAVETLESKELLEEIDLLLALKMNIEADCLQSSVEEPEVPEKIPAYRRPALETLLAKWRQNLNRSTSEAFQDTLHDKGNEPLTNDFGLATRILKFGVFETGHGSVALFSRGLVRSEDQSLYAKHLEIPLKTLIYEGPDLSVRTVITKLRNFFGENLGSKFSSAKVYKILAEIRSELPDFNSNSVISEELANSICRRLGWNVCFRAS
jgi:hypothetical protein